MKKPKPEKPHAITVARHYFKKNTYVIKRMLVKAKPDGTLYWYTFGNQTESPDRKKLEILAQKKCGYLKIPYIADLQHGQKLSSNDMFIIGQYMGFPPYDADKERGKP